MNFQINNDTNVSMDNNVVIINGERIPLKSHKANNVTVINNHVYVNGYEYKNGKWKRTLKALWYYLF